MLRLRGACKVLRSGINSGEFFARLLRELGVRRIEELEHHAAPQRIFTLCCTVWAERQFVHMATAACRQAAGLGPGDEAPCVVAGGFALHRQLLLGGEADDVTWKAGDLDVFVSGGRRQWSATEKLLHAESMSPKPLSVHGAKTTGRSRP
jgi:hypothetical protein